MSTSTFDRPQGIAAGEWPICFPGQQSYSVSLNRSVGTDRARIFQAITVPEYMEAWFTAPGSVAGHTRVFGADGSFSICGQIEDGSRFRISCAYRVYRRSKLVFSWKQDSLAEGRESLVRIRLLGDFERTTVDVSHTGLCEIERQWCEEMWGASLEKLSRLF